MYKLVIQDDEGKTTVVPLIRDELRRYIPHLEYQPLQRCGHSPWLERHASDAFYSRLHAWLARWLV